MSFLSRFWARFSSPSITPVHHEGVYRSSKAPLKPERLPDGSLKPVRPAQTTLFERPAPVPVVPPTTEADSYRWLDNGDIPVTMMPLPPTPPPEATFDPVKNGTILSGTCSFVSGLTYRCVALTGRLWS